MFVTTVYTIAPYEKAIVTRFGNIRDITTQPGIHYRTPFLDSVTVYSTKLQHHYIQEAGVITRNKQNILLDVLVVYKIDDAEKFYKTSRTLKHAVKRLDDIVYSSMLSNIGKYTFDDVVNKQREVILNQITEDTREQIKNYGLEILGVNFKAVMLMQENETSVLNSMISERNRESTQYRAEGEVLSKTIRSKAELSAATTISEAQIKAAKIKADGDMEAQRIIAGSLKDPSLYRFIKDLEMYTENLKPGTKYYISPKNKAFSNMFNF